MTANANGICKSSAHDFVTKKQVIDGSTPNANVADVTEVYCRKCGTVCILSQPRVAVAGLTN